MTELQKYRLAEEQIYIRAISHILQVKLKHKENRFILKFLQKQSNIILKYLSILY